MHHLNLKVNPLVSVGPIQFGMKRSVARNAVGYAFVELKRYKDEPYPEDFFKELWMRIGYKIHFLVETVEFIHGTPLTISYKNENLFKPFNELKSFLEKDDLELETDHEGITSHKLGIGAWYPHLAEEPENLPESIIFFEEGYYQ